MSDAFFDTDLLIRYVMGDDPGKRAVVRNLLRQAAQGAIRLYAPDTVIADAVCVLASPRLYHVPGQQIRNWLSILIRWPGLEVDNRVVMLKALALYANSSLDFGDLMIVAAMDDANIPTLYSYDRDFNRFFPSQAPGALRSEVEQANPDSGIALPHSPLKGKRRLRLPRSARP